VQETFQQQCRKAKYAGKSTSHHQSCGSIHGFGARKEMKIDDITDSSLQQYVVIKSGEIIQSGLGLLPRGIARNGLGNLG